MRMRFLRSERGTSVVEFAIAAPVMILLVIGLIEMGRYTYFSILAQNAAAAGARYGAQNLQKAKDTTGITNAAVNDAQNLSQWQVTPGWICAQNGAIISCPSTTPPPGTFYYVKVQVTGLFHSLMNYPGVPTSMPLSATSIVRVESQ